jgi:hypothetical protein
VIAERPSGRPAVAVLPKHPERAVPPREQRWRRSRFARRRST